MYNNINWNFDSKYIYKIMLWLKTNFCIYYFLIYLWQTSASFLNINVLNFKLVYKRKTYRNSNIIKYDKTIEQNFVDQRMVKFLFRIPLLPDLKSLLKLYQNNGTTIAKDSLRNRKPEEQFHKNGYHTGRTHAGKKRNIIEQNDLLKCEAV